MPSKVFSLAAEYLPNFLTLYFQVLEEPKETTASQMVPMAEGETEPPDDATEIPGFVVETVEFVDGESLGGKVLVNENGQYVIEAETEHVKVLAADELALQYSIEVEGGEQWTV